MLVPGDLGFSSLVLALCLLLGLVIRRKWLQGQARQEEIKRLLVFAAEEAARAELEASSTYAVVPAAPTYQCAVCYSPTTTRCAQCKAVRYCSGKCQIVHWRQGHREECRPAPITYRAADAGNNYHVKAARQDGSLFNSERTETEDRKPEKPIETFTREPVLSNSGCCPEIPSGNDDDIKVQFLVDEKGSSSISESSGVSFSGFSTSCSGSESSDDVSVGESISSYDPAKPDEQMSADASLDIENTAGADNLDKTKPPSPKFASLVNSVNSYTCSSKFDQIKPSPSNLEDHASTSSSGPSTSVMHEDSVSVSCTSSSGFWERALNSGRPQDNVDVESCPVDSSGFGNSSVLDSKPVLKFSFKLSGSTISPSDSHHEDLESTDALPATSRISVPVEGTSFSKKISSDAAKVRHSPSLDGARSSLKDTSTALFVSKSKEVKLSSPLSVRDPSFGFGGSSLKTDAAHIGSLLPSSTRGSSFSEKFSTDAAKVRVSPSLNGAKTSLKDTGTASFVSKSKEVKLSSPLSVCDPSFGTGGSSLKTDVSHISSLQPSSSQRPYSLTATGKPSVSSNSSGSDVHSSSAGGNTVMSVKSEKIDGVHVAVVSSQGASYVPNGKNGLKTSMWKVVDQLRGSKPKHNPLSVGSEVAGRYNDKGLFPYDTFVKLYNWNKVEHLPCGLINCGNSCYANSVLQCLAFTPPLTAYLLQGLHSRSCAKKDWCFTCEFERLILKAKEGTSPLSPIGILSRLQNIGSQLGHGREEDAHEFLRYAIDTMQSVCLKEAGAKPGSSEEETTLIGLTFGGYLRSKIKCTKCQGKSERQEQMMDLTVEIEGDIGTLEEALRQFTGTEILDGENKYYCSRCKSYEKAKKKLSVLEAPNVLTIALKRFQSGKFGKLNKPIRFPEILDLAPYMTGTSDKSPIYRLCGVVVHLDIMNAAFSGHYVCYVKNIQNKWFKIDDSTVTTVELERVLTKGAYMLLYSRCSPRAPRCIRSRIVTSEPKTKPGSCREGGKRTTAKSRAATMDPIHVQIPSPVSSTSYESFYTNFHRLQKVLEADSSSDNSSLISSNSDEGSCSTRDSTSTDELSDYIFGDLGHEWNSPWRSSSDSDTSSSTSTSPPLYSRHSPLGESGRYSSTEYGSERNGMLRHNADSEGQTFLQSDSTKQCRKLVNSNFRETDPDPEKVGRLNSLNDVRVRKSSTRTD